MIAASTRSRGRINQWVRHFGMRSFARWRSQFDFIRMLCRHVMNVIRWVWRSNRGGAITTATSNSFASIIIDHKEMIFNPGFSHSLTIGLEKKSEAKRRKETKRKERRREEKRKDFEKKRKEEIRGNKRRMEGTKPFFSLFLPAVSTAVFKGQTQTQKRALKTQKLKTQNSPSQPCYLIIYY